MNPAAAVIPFREVRHHGPEDWLFQESLTVRGELHGGHIPAHRHEGMHQFKIIEGGQVDATVNGISYTLQSPCALMLPPGTVHGFTFQPHCRGRVVTLPSGHLRSALQRTACLAAQLDGPLVLQAAQIQDDFAECVALFDALGREFERQCFGRIEVLQAHSVQLAVWFLRRAHGDSHLPVQYDVPRDALVQRYLALVEQHFRQPLTLSFYASELKISTDHLSRTCRSVRGTSARALLHKRKYVEATRLLRNPTLRIADIAQALGFEDAAYFSRFFARHAGQSPAAFRHGMATGRHTALAA